jgi:hypothetical protein
VSATAKEGDVSATDDVSKEVPPELGRAIARTIASSARAVLEQRGIAEAEKIGRELGNNCAHGVFLLVERFLNDGIVALENEIEAARSDAR